MTVEDAPPEEAGAGHPPAPAWSNWSDDQLLDLRFSELGLAIEGSWLEERIGASTPEVFRFYRPRCDRVVGRVMAVITGDDTLKCG